MPTFRCVRLLLLVVAISVMQNGLSRLSAADPESSDAATSLDLFNKRILPIFQAKHPSSCAECHLSGVDLKDYIHPDQKQTFASLVAGGLIDVRKPDESRLLRFIDRRPDSPNLVTDKIRKQEHDAFRAWIRAAVKDPDLLAAKTTAGIGPQLPNEVIRHARQDRVLASFIENVWTEVGRCAACHSPDQNQKQVQEHGDQVSWITLRDPQATLRHMVESAIINPDEPLESLLLMKPTMQVDHGGGQKMVVGDRTYKQFRRFIDDYARVAAGQYKSADDLPQPADELSVVTDIWFKITDVPEKYDQMLLQADLYRQTDAGWSKYRVATSDRPVFGKGRLWQHSLSLTAPRNSEWATKIADGKLPAGRYLVKLYVDQKNKLQQDFTAELADADFVGQFEIQSQWKAGYGNMAVGSFPQQ